MTTTKTNDPYRTTYHRDGSVTIWNSYTQTWIRTRKPSDQLLSTLSHAEVDRVKKHISRG